jgi:long-chain acyl-CoA synthetase
MVRGTKESTEHRGAAQPVGPESADPFVVAGRAAARLARQVDLALQDADLSAPQYRVLAFLARGSQVASGIAGRLDVTRPTVTAIVDGLVARGLVERHTEPDDRRRVHHLLTAAGHRAVAAGDAAVTARLQTIAGHLSAGDADRALRALELWHDALDAAAMAVPAGR